VNAETTRRKHMGNTWRHQWRHWFSG
jgi:hypothetical protein